MTEFANIELALIAPSLTNPRKSFNVAKLTELADSIRTSGVHQPVLVRALPGSRMADTDRQVQYELVAGERRYRASQQAGVATIPALVRTLTDEQVLEIQIVENLQRDDLTELEEAEGYQALMHHSALTSDQVGAKIGKSRAYVYARLKLLDLSMECKQAMRDGLVDFSRALLIARIPDTTLQTKALAEATRQDFRGEVPSVRALQSWLQANVMLRLDRATFKITDSQLVKTAGSCKDCPKRTGANPDLFADVDGADICTDPICYHSKEDAQRASMLATAEAKGMRLIEGKEAKEICNQYRPHIKGYLPLSQVRTDIEGEAEVKLGTVLGKDGPQPVLIENPWTKELIAAVPEAEAEAVLLARGLLKASKVADDAQDTREMLQDDILLLKKSTERKIRVNGRKNMFEALVSGIRSLDDKAVCALLTPAMLRAWLISRVGEWDEEHLASWLGITPPDDLDFGQTLDYLRLHIQACESIKLYQVLAISMIEEDQAYPWNQGDGIEPELFKPMAEQLGIDLQAIQANTAADAKHDMQDELKRLKAELKKVNAPPASLAQPTPAAGKATKAAPKQKLSAQDAQAAIAAAMQEQLPVGFAIGQRVRVTAEHLHPKQAKWAGKEGTITGKVGDAWDVTFKGRTGGISSFCVDQIEVVAA